MWRVWKHLQKLVDAQVSQCLHSPRPRQETAEVLHMREGIPARVEEEGARGYTLGGIAFQLPVSLETKHWIVWWSFLLYFDVFQLLRKAEQVQEQQLKAWAEMQESSRGSSHGAPCFRTRKKRCSRFSHSPRGGWWWRECSWRRGNQHLTKGQIYNCMEAFKTCFKLLFFYTIWSWLLIINSIVIRRTRDGFLLMPSLSINITA